MKEGRIALASLPKSDFQIKNRPVFLLRRLPPIYANTLLLCTGLSD